MTLLGMIYCVHPTASHPLLIYAEMIHNTQYYTVVVLPLQVMHVSMGVRPKERESSNQHWLLQNSVGSTVTVLDDTVATCSILIYHCADGAIIAGTRNAFALLI